MGWWKQGDELLGDGPVDVFEDGLREFVAEHAPPPWQDFVNAVSAALPQVSGTMSFDAASLKNRQLRFHLEPPGKDLVNVDAGSNFVLRDALVEIFNNIAGEYEERQGRMPTLSEVLGTISFSLGVRPERFILDGKGTSLARIESVNPE